MTEAFTTIPYECGAHHADGVRELLAKHSVRGVTYTDARTLLGLRMSFSVCCPEHFAERLMQQIAAFETSRQADDTW